MQPDSLRIATLHLLGDTKRGEKGAPAPPGGPPARSLTLAPTQIAGYSATACRAGSVWAAASSTATPLYCRQALMTSSLEGS